MLKTRVILSLLLSSSATVALADNTHGSVVLEAAWSELPATVLAGQNGSGSIHEVNGINGSFKYNIINSTDSNLNFYFTVKMENGICSLDANNSDLIEDNRGHWTYTVNVTSTSGPQNYQTTCDITVNSIPNKPPAYYSKLKLEHLQYLQVGTSVCSANDLPGLTITDIKPYTFNNVNYLAVAAANYKCGKGTTVLIYEWKNATNKYELVDKVESDNRPYFRISAIEFFESKLENEDPKGILLIADYSDSNWDTSKAHVDVWTRSTSSKFGPMEESKGTKLIGDGIKDLEHFKVGKIDYVMVVNQGSRVTGYGNTSHVYRWDPRDVKFLNDDYDSAGNCPQGSFCKQSIASYGAQKANTFNMNGTVYVGLANRNNESTFDVTSTIYTATETYIPLQERQTNINTYGSLMLDAFPIGQKHYLISADNYSDLNGHNESSGLREADATGFFTATTYLYNPGVTAWKNIEFNGENYLFAALPNSPGKMYHWCPSADTAPEHWCGPVNRGEFKPYGSNADIPTHIGGAYDTVGWDSLTIDGQLYILRYFSTDPNSQLVEGVQVYKATE